MKELYLRIGLIIAGVLLFISTFDSVTAIIDVGFVGRLLLSVVILILIILLIILRKK